MTYQEFLAAGLPASSGRQYYSCRSCSPSRMFTPLPVMSVNGTIFLINHICLILLKLFQTCFSVIKLVQSCSKLYKLVQTCSKLLYFVQTCSNMLKLVLINHTCSIFFKRFQTCFAQSYMFKLVQTFSNLFKPIQTCPNLC